MSKNPGNTGHHYKMAKVTGAEVQAGQVLVHLDCGHDYLYMPWRDPEAAARWYNEERVGKRERCYKCVGSEASHAN